MAMRAWTWAACVVAAAAVIAGPRSAAAQAPPAGEVALKNGGILRGAVVSIEPGKEVVLVVEGLGETRRLPWDEVAWVNGGATAPAPPFPSPPPPMPGELGAPRIHIVSNRPVSLREDSVTFEGVRHPAICRTPCDVIVDGRSGRSFYFAGDEVPSSEHFVLNEKSGNVTARVSTGNAALQSAGSAFLALGILGATTGAVLLPVGVAVNAARASEPIFARSSPSPVPLVGGVILGTGVAMLTAGIVMTVTGTTRYKLETTAGATRISLEPGVIRF